MTYFFMLIKGAGVIENFQTKIAALVRENRRTTGFGQWTYMIKKKGAENSLQD